MKIWMINSVCGTGSTGRICTDIAQCLRENGHDCKIAYGRGTVPERYQTYAQRIGSALGVCAHGAAARLFDCAGFASRMATERLIKQIEAYDPDVIHLHNLHGYYLDVQTLFSYLKRAKKPVVWTLHDCWALTGHCAHFAAAGCEKWKTQCFACAEKRRYPASLLLDRCREHYRRKKELFSGLENLTLVTPSRWLRGVLSESFLKDYPAVVIPNGIDTAVFHPVCDDVRARLCLPDKKLVLGVAAVWNERKGFADMLRLAQLLGEGYCVVLVGLLPRRCGALGANVKTIRYTASAETLAALYTAAEVLVNPTYEDTYPTVNLEAQACKTPVITYRTGGSVESAHPSGVTAQGDIEAVAAKIRAGGLTCRRDLRLDCRPMARRYLALYERVTGWGRACDAAGGEA